MYDAVIVGAGHNGLTAAAYLAAAGLNTLVVEARDTVGGAAATQEFAPGFRVSTASYSLSLLRPDIHRDLGLAGRGLEIVPKDPQMFVPLPGERHLFIWKDANRSAEEISRIHPRDAIGYLQWNAFWKEAIPLFRKVIDDPEPPPLAEIESHFQQQGRAEMWRLAVAGSAAETVSEFFESDELRGAFASQGIIGISASPREAGTAWVMTYHYLGGEVCGADGTWAYVMGGMGALSETLAEVASERGAKIRTSTQAEEILVEGGRAAGVRLIDGEEIPASVVVSNADPRRTFLDLAPPGALAPEFVKTVDEWRMDGAVVKVNLALSELPEFRGLTKGGVGPEHLG
ncbi:MAG: phytoene desaturase family protein, partial [Actinomycetota bacterium]